MDKDLNTVVSIIMPAFNAEKYIAESIVSVLEQTFSHWELLIVNDGSTDETQSIAEGYSIQDSRIKVINQQNKKLGAARNAGLANAKGIWIAFLDADDLWHPDKLEKQISFGNEFPDIGLIYTDGWIFENNELNCLVPYPTLKGKYQGKDMYVNEYRGNNIPVLSVMVKKDIVDLVGPQEEIVYGCEDWDYWLRIASENVIFYGMADKLFYYRKHSNNMSNDLAVMLYAQAQVLLKNADSEHFGNDERAIVKNLIFNSIKQLIAARKFKEIDHLLDISKNILPGSSIIKKMVKTFRKWAIIPITAISTLIKIQNKLFRPLLYERV